MKLFVYFSLIFIVSLFLSKSDVSLEEEIESIPESETIITDEDEKKLSDMRDKSVKLEYKTEVSQMLQIIVNNLYRKKEVFLRELISNSFDALDKVRFASLTDPSILDPEPDLHIHVHIDKVNRILTVTDTGIGMCREELLINLGTIAKSGTRDFITKLSGMNESSTSLSSQIGQFGVGFYSVFLVADRVVVASKCHSEPVQHIFEADTGSIQVFEDPRNSPLPRGTSVMLYLNQEASDFLKEDTIENLIKKYSEFIMFPIFVFSTLDDDRKEVAPHWRHVNRVSPLWMRPAKNISESEYEDFYNSITYGHKRERYAAPLGWVHVFAEGETNFVALLFISDKLDDDFFNSIQTPKSSIKLYVRRVLINSEIGGFFPHYLSFVSGIVDSEDLPLNVGREMAQHNELIKVIVKKLKRKILDYLKKLMLNESEKYDKIYAQFSSALKLGIVEDETNSNRIARLLKFYSTQSPEKMITLDDYVSRMKPGQPGILFITASSIESANKSPYMERIKLKGYEILYMLDNIDEAIMQNLRVYDNKAIYNIAKEVSDIPQSKSEEKVLKEKEVEFKPLLDWLKKTHFKGRIALARLSTRLLTSSCILMASEQGYSGNMDNMVRSQTNMQSKHSGAEDVLNQPKNIEINPHHPLIKYMLNQVIDDPTSSDLEENAEVCFSIATLSGGYPIDDGVKLAGLIERLYLKSHSISGDNISQNIYDELGIEDEEIAHDQHRDSDSSEKSESVKEEL